VVNVVEMISMQAFRTNTLWQTFRVKYHAIELWGLYHPIEII